MGRAPCCDKDNVKKGPWSPEEDAKLKSYIEKHGTGGNWIALPQKIGLRRCGKSCRLRWLNYLRPNLRHGGFSEEEDSIICSLYISIGSRWSIIASQLPGRTDNDIKNYWNTRLKKKFLGNQLRGTQSNRNYGVKRSESDGMNTLKQEVNKETMANSLVTCNNSHNIDQDHDQIRPYWAMDVPYTIPNRSSSSKDFLVKLDGEDKQGLMVADGASFTFQMVTSFSPSASSMDYTPHEALLQTQFGTEHSETGFEGIQGQSSIDYSDELLFSNPLACGESNIGSWGYFTSLMTTLPPSCSSDDYNRTLNPPTLH